MIAVNIVLQVALALSPQMSTTQQTADIAAKERARRAAKESFTLNFRELQVLGKGLLKAHESGGLGPERLARDTKTIQKRARSLRGLMALGEPREQTRIETILRSPHDFDRAIRQLAQLVTDFAHNPVHQNSKVFDTNLAGKAAADLVAIVDLAKAIERRAKDYVKPR